MGPRWSFTCSRVRRDCANKIKTPELSGVHVSEGIPYSGVQNRITPHERYLTTQTTTQIVPVVIPVHRNLQKQSPVRSRPGPWLQLGQSGAQAGQHNSTERLSVGVSRHRQQQVLMMTNCMTPSFLATQGIITQDVTSVNEFA